MKRIYFLLSIVLVLGLVAVLSFRLGESFATAKYQQSLYNVSKGLLNFEGKPRSIRLVYVDRKREPEFPEGMYVVYFVVAERPIMVKDYAIDHYGNAYELGGRGRTKRLSSMTLTKYLFSR